MLPSLHNTLHVVLCPDKVILLGRAKGFRRDIRVQTSLACESATEQVLGWQPALHALEIWLQENSQHRSKVRFVLSNRFVRYSLIPWSNEIRTVQEDMALAKAVFKDTYADLSRDWSIAMADTGYQQPKLAAAIDTELLEGIRRLCSVSRLILDSIQPWLTVAYSHFLSQIDSDSGLLAVEESGQLVTLAFQGKALTSVRKEIVSGTERLQDYVHRELVCCGLGVDAPIYLQMMSGNYQSAHDGNLRIRLLRAGDESSHFDVALSDGPRQTLVLNFYSRRFSGSRPGRMLLAGSLLLVACLSYFYVSSYAEYQQNMNERARMDAVVQQVRNQNSDPGMSNQMQHATRVIEQLSFPWNKLFFALESATVKDVVLLAVQPDLQTGIITLNGEAKNWNAMVVYLRRLEAERLFTGVQLASHQIQLNDPQKPVRFVFQCGWGKTLP